MRKFYSLVLMAAALLIGTNAWAQDPIATISIDGGAAQNITSDLLSEGINQINNGQSAVITLLQDASLGSTKTSVVLDGGKNLTIDLNGKHLDSYAIFNLFNATLNITSNAPALYEMKVAAQFASVFGSKYKAEPYGYCNLIVGENVTIESNSQYGLAIFPRDYYDATYTGTVTKDNGDINQSNWAKMNGAGAGVTVDIYGSILSLYGISTNGQLNATMGNVPVINIHENAVITTSNYNGIYAGGYAIWNIQGHVTGTTGIYAKAGVFNLDGAEIKGTAPYEAPTENNNGTSGGGSGIVFDGNKAYAGEMELTVTGETKVISTNGYAFEELVTSANKSETNSIDIQSGTFEGDVKMGSLTMTPELGNDVKVKGSITGGTYNSDITEYLSNVTGVITPTTDEQGNTVYVINEKPAEKSWLTTIVGASAADYVRMENGAPVTLDDDAQAKYLVMIGTAKIVVPAGKKLTVEEIVMGADAVIEVVAGGKLIVTGEQGIVSNHASNLVLKTSKTAQAIFLLNPAVTSNKHPNATVQLQTYSWYESSTSYQWQRFGIPTFGAVTSFECVENAVNTQIQAFDNGNWVSLGYIGGSPALNVADLNKPFITYNLIANRAQTDAAPVYDIKGELVGNENASLNAYSEWNLFSNSYLAKVDVEAFLGDLAGVDQVVYIATPAGVGTYTWDAKDLEWAAGVKLNPMAAFILHNPGEAAISAINYEKAVYEPATKGSSPAPRRFAQTSDKTAKLRVIVANEEGVCDDVKMTEKTSNLHNAAKYMNDDLNIYAMADEKAAIVATEDLENTYVGFSTVKGGKFTISFANVEGREFTLVDHETGARVAIAEGNTYEFTADANSANDYRFEIVGRANMPTAIDNTEAVKSAKGVYTITGQYVGEMNIWNTLPAGVYVVNGEKRVK